MIIQKMRYKIGLVLDDIEEEYGIKIIYACESGSRAWNFASADSDWDVRFVYKYPLNSYLNVLGRGRDTIEKKDEILDLDIVGWDLKKAMYLFAQQNPQLVEWLNSPIIYRRNEQFHYDLLALRARFMPPYLCLHHYYSMGMKDWDFIVKHDGDASLKKYFYVLRCIFSCLWIPEKGFPPIDFKELYEGCKSLSKDLKTEIEYLYDLKRLGGEEHFEKVSEDLLVFIRDSFFESVKYLNYANDLRHPIKIDRFCKGVNELFIDVLKGGKYSEIEQV